MSAPPIHSRKAPIDGPLSEAEDLLDSRPDLALDWISRVRTGQGDGPRARRLTARAHWRLGLTCTANGDFEGAVREHRRAAETEPDVPELWIGLGDALGRAGQAEAAGAAYLHSIKVSVNEPSVAQAALHLSNNQLPAAEALLRGRLKVFPTDISAIRMLGELAARLGRTEDALGLLRRSLELAPGFDAAREFLARLLGRNRPVEALAEIEHLLERMPDNPSHAMFKASLLVRVGDQEGAREIYQCLLARNAAQPRIWMSLGHVLKTLGRQQEAIEAYRHAIAHQPGIGEAWWSLANLKTIRFTEDDRQAMRAAVQTATDDEDRLHLHFALGKALEDAREAAEAFTHYDAGNRIRRRQLTYSADDTEDQCRRLEALFTPAFLKAREGWGCAAPDPIFIVGLPRSGSTLVEQILSSHSQVEGTMELPDLMSMAARLRSFEARSPAGRYPELLAGLDPEALAGLGEEYLQRTRVQRKTGRPLFIDKMPNNWQHVGLIRLILPRAKIVDARRHPMACCLSGWKQHFARGQAFSYELTDIGRYYADYVRLMAAYDRAAPGRVHRVIYEHLVQDTEGEVRRLLDHLGLPFEEGCLAFWRNERAVRTASSEQVRQPIFKDAVEHWKIFEPWLSALQAAVGPIAEAYPELPAD